MLECHNLIQIKVDTLLSVPPFFGLFVLLVVFSLLVYEIQNLGKYFKHLLFYIYLVNQ